MINATIAFDNGQTRRSCIIRNLSDTGAKLEMASIKGVPPTFDLLAKGHRAEHCRVVWRSLRELGVQFLGHD